jgi:hypothetical protein
MYPQTLKIFLTRTISIRFTCVHEIPNAIAELLMTNIPLVHIAVAVVIL